MTEKFKKSLARVAQIMGKKGGKSGMSDIKISQNEEYLAYTSMKEIHLWCPNR